MKWNITLSKTKRSKLIGVLAVAALAAGGWYWYSAAAQKPENESLRPIAVTRANIEEVVTSQGKLEAKQYVDVGTQVSGQLKAIHVDIGDTVTKGQLLAEIDPRVYQAQVEAGEAGLNSLRAQLNQQKAEAVLAEQNLKRNQNLIAVNAVSQQALQETESQAEVEKAQVNSIIAQIQQTESNLKASRTNLSYTKIYAPMAGTVTTLPTKEGQTLNANQTAPVVLQVANLDTMTVRAQVAEADVSRIKENMPAYFTTLGNNERRWPGKVRQVLPTPQIVNDVVLYDVLIDVKNESRKLMTGMTTQVFFIFGKAENALVIPAEVLTRRAVREDNDKGKAYRVTVITETSQEQRVIHVGLQTRTQAEVVDGLKEGEKIAVNRPAGAANRTASQANNAQRGAGNAPRLNRGPQL
ncbi:MAG TPA: efflux RND transporter periplasmic adaptor subunit [Candidatus Binatia bacterium]|jgi:macrolide-specific efflux system membrane fusion protein|nr:efflux RND transporter periplasmic adaptor subunit [Candidatus Binatia bacterium]